MPHESGLQISPGISRIIVSQGASRLRENFPSLNSSNSIRVGDANTEIYRVYRPDLISLIGWPDLSSCQGIEPSDPICLRILPTIRSEPALDRKHVTAVLDIERRICGSVRCHKLRRVRPKILNAVK
jgi:hypothetical protein